MVVNKYWWVPRFQKEFIPAIDYFARSLKERVLAAFNDDDLNREADRVRDEAYARMQESGSPEDVSEDYIADAAMHAGVDHYTMMKGIIQGIVNLFTIGLFHLFEQQLLYFHRTELLMRHEEDNPDLLKLDKAKEILLRDYKIDIERFSAWGKVNELRLVANTVKHADGTSAEKLKTLRPELFRHPEFDRDSRRSGLAITPGQVFQPMAGQDVYITVDEFNLYVEAVKHFWFELSSAFEGI